MTAFTGVVDSPKGFTVMRVSTEMLDWVMNLKYDMRVRSCDLVLRELRCIYDSYDDAQPNPASSVLVPVGGGFK